MTPDGRDLFNFIATEKRSNDTFDYPVKISRKQYYSRLSKLVKTDLIKRKGAKYVLTPFGDVILCNSNLQAVARAYGTEERNTHNN